MRKHCLVVAAIAAVMAMPVPAMAGGQDLSMWGIFNDGAVTPVLWYVYGGSRYTVDARYNFDQPKSFTLLVGKPLLGKGVAIFPYAGVLFGERHGVVGQVNVLVIRGGKSVFSLNEYVRVSGYPDLAYHWTEGLVRIHQRLSVGFGEQAFKELPGKCFVDIGPAAKLHAGSAYAKAWATVDPFHEWDRKLFVGVGYAF